MDPDGDPVNYTVEWTVAGAVFTDTQTTALPGDTVPVAELVLGSTWTCTITPFDAESEGTAATATYTVGEGSDSGEPVV